MIRTGIITAERPRPTLAESVRSYRAAGFEGEVLVFNDNGDVNVDGVKVLQNEVHLGNKLNWTRALSTLVSGFPMSDWIMICEDDISWSQGAARDLDEMLADRYHHNTLRQAGALSLYTPRRISRLLEANGRLVPGWYSAGVQMGRKTWGAQCYLFSWDMATRLLDDTQFKRIMLDTARDKNIDAIVGQCINDSGYDILYRIPCLVNHDLGRANSSLGYKDDRPMLETDYFRGPRA